MLWTMENHKKKLGKAWNILLEIPLEKSKSFFHHTRLKKSKIVFILIVLWQFHLNVSTTKYEPLLYLDKDNIQPHFVNMSHYQIQNNLI